MKGRKIVSILLVLTLLITVLPVQVFGNDKVGVGDPISQELETQETIPSAIQILPSKYIGDHYEVEFKVNSKWPGNFNGELIVTNTGKKALENWTLKFDFDHEISNIWNAQIASHESQSYIIKNLGWNQDIAPGKSVSIGFTAKWDDNIVPPRNYETLGTKQEVEETDYTIKFKVTSDWGQAFNGEISITNNTEETIEDWMLEFDFDRKIERFWTAEIVEHDENHYIIKNLGYNANIKPGETIKLGFAGNPGNVNSEPENYILEQVGMEIDYVKDSDGDGLPDWFEKEIGTNPYKEDTDGDGLPDGYEYYVLGTDPLKRDTDGNGIEDGDEDFDEDGLTNIEEYELETDPHNEDTDFDGLTDYDEVYMYGTDPLKADTDDDGLEDGDEILFGFDPLNPDTNGNGILDGDEKTYQEYEEIINEQEKPEITKVSVAFEGNGNLQKTTSIENLYNIDMLSTDVVGLVGVPVEINTTSEFDTTTITFHYNETLLGDIPEEDLCIMWYDEQNEWYEILDEKSIIDEENNTVSVVTNHFSTYLVVNRQEWYKAWNTSLDYRTPTHPQIPASYYDIALVLDSSGSMGGTPIANAKHAARSFVSAMYPNDRIGIITFNSAAKTIADMTYAKSNAKKEELKELINTKIIASGGTATNTGLNRALDMLKDNTTLNKKIIVLLCDGDVQDPTAVIEKAKGNSVKIYTVNFGSSGTDRLTKMAKDTGGKHYNAKTAEQLIKAFYDIEQETYAEIDMTDTDGDDLPDVFEVIGMQLANGKMVTSDPTKKDTDGDGLTDYEEMGKFIVDKQVYLGEGKYAYKIHFNGKSDPRKKDSDGDGYNDPDDPRPLISDVIKTQLNDAEQFVPIIEGNMVFYGGDQSWFEPNKIGENGGCGTVSAANIATYMAKNKINYGDLYDYDAYSITKDEFKNHMDEVYKYLKPKKIPTPTGGIALGIWPLNSFVKGFEKFANSKSVKLKAQRSNKQYTNENVTEYIKEGLKMNKPLALLIGFNNKTRSIKITAPDQTWHQDISMHWVTITAIKEDLIKKTTTVKVSTWDGYAAIPLNTTDTMTIGYIKKRNMPLSRLGKKYVEELEKYKDNVL